MKAGPKWLMILFPLGLLFMSLDGHPLAAMCYVVIIARHWLADERPKAWAVVGLSSVVSVIIMGSLALGVFYAFTGALGCFLGLMIQWNLSYAHRLWMLTGIAFVTSGTLLLVAWDSIRHDWTILWNARIAEMEAQANVNEQWLEIIRWYDVNFAYIGMGSLFASIVLMVAAVLCLVDRVGRPLTGDTPRKTSGFQRMSLPDGLVWLVIAVALLWFADQRWPNDALRMVTWNAAVALTTVYWLNGLSILLYALAIMKVSALATMAIVSGMVVFGLMQLLGLIGLFDTWYDFRIRFRRLAMLRRVAKNNDDYDN